MNRYYTEFKGTTVEVKGDDFNRALRTFTKKIQDLGLLKEVKDRMAYVKPTAQRQHMKKQARKRWEKQVESMINDGIWHKDKNY